MGNDERAELHKVAATQYCPATLVSARPTGSYIGTASKQNERSDKSREAHGADRKLTDSNVSANHTPRFGGVFLFAAASLWHSGVRYFTWPFDAIDVVTSALPSAALEVEIGKVLN